MNYLSAVERRFTYWPDRDLPSIRAGLSEAVVAELAEANGEDAQWYGGGTAALDVTNVEGGKLIRRNAKSVRLETKGGIDYVVLARRNAQPFDSSKLDRVTLVHLAEAASGYNVDLESGIVSMEGHAAVDRVWDLTVDELNELMPVHDPDVDPVWRNVELDIEDLEPYLVWKRRRVAKHKPQLEPLTEADLDDLLRKMKASPTGVQVLQWTVSTDDRSRILNEIDSALQFMMSTELMAAEPDRYTALSSISTPEQRLAVASSAHRFYTHQMNASGDAVVAVCAEIVRAVLADREPAAHQWMPLKNYCLLAEENSTTLLYRDALRWYGPVFVRQSYSTLDGGWTLYMPESIPSVDAALEE